MAKPRRFNWRLWTIDVVRWDSDTPQSRYGRLLARKTERPKLSALGEIIESAQVSDREAAVAAGHELLDRFAGQARGTVTIEIHLAGPEQTIEDEKQARLRRADRPRRGRPAPGASDARIKPGDTSPS